MIDAVRRFLDHVTQDRDQSPHTARSYRVDLQDLVGYLAAESSSKKCPGPTEVDALAIRGWVADMHGRGLSPATIGRRLSAARSLFDWLGRRDEVNPESVRYLTRTGTYSCEKARRLLGYDPAVDLDEGMRRVADSLR